MLTTSLIKFKEVIFMHSNNIEIEFIVNKILYKKKIIDKSIYDKVENKLNKLLYKKHK